MTMMMPMMMITLRRAPPKRLALDVELLSWYGEYLEHASQRNR